MSREKLDRYRRGSGQGQDTSALVRLMSVVHVEHELLELTGEEGLVYISVATTRLYKTRKQSRA